MERSQSLTELSKGLAAFQAKMGAIKKDSSNPFFKNKYASLSTILASINPLLSECGLSVSQFPDGETGLTTILMHTSGEYLQATYHIHPVKSDPQGIGSAITYARRYAIGAVLGLNIDDDDDGNSSSTTPKGKKQENGMSEEVYQQWVDLVEACTTIEELTKKYNENAKAIADMPVVKNLFTNRKNKLQA